MTYSLANVRISANQNINLFRMQCPTDKKLYIYQAQACASGGLGISGMKVEVLANSSLPLNGSHSIYSTSSQILQQGNPLAESSADDFVEGRFMYSGGANGLAGNNYQYGSCSIQVMVI